MSGGHFHVHGPHDHAVEHAALRRMTDAGFGVVFGAIGVMGLLHIQPGYPAHPGSGKPSIGEPCGTC